MAAVRGGSDVKRFFAALPGKLQNSVLRGAARAAATVVADEARLRSISPEVSSAIKLSRAKTEADRVTVKVQVKGDGAYIAPWLEYGTAAHFISVDDSQRGGRSIRRINRQLKANGENHSLVIGGNFVGETVLHPGARPYPFLRPALDTKEGEAVAAAQDYIMSRVTRAGIRADAEAEE